VKSFRNILAVFDRADGSRLALDRAAELAADNQARLTVAVCLEEFAENESSELKRAMLHGLEHHFTALVEPLRAKGMAVNAHVLPGRPFIQIIRQVLRQGHDLVVKAANPGDQRVRPLFGSTDLHLLRKCPATVWFVSDRAHSPQRAPVVAAIAPFSGDDPGELSLNRRIMDIAVALAHRTGGDLYVVQVTSPPDDAILRTLRRPERADELRAQVRASQAALKTRFAEFVAGWSSSGPTIAPHFLIGNPDALIADLARDRDAGMIVLASVRRVGIPGQLVGSTAESIVSQVSCSVLALKPDGFVSPVAA
jgi:nucleotide-binding universal stress UspA family protein